MVNEDASCLNKRKYETREQAIFAFRTYKANMQRNRGRRVDKLKGEQFPYKCVYCGGWHLTTR